MIKRILCTSMLLLLFAVSAFASDRDKAVNLVQQAVAYYKANGLEKTLPEMGKGGKFDKGELYVFAYDHDGTMVAHPDVTLVGQNLIDTTDVKGKKFRREIVETAKKDGKGWVSYTYLNKKTKVETEKETYFELSGDLIFACGIYK